MLVKGRWKKLLFFCMVCFLFAGREIKTAHAGAEGFTQEEKEYIESLGVLKVGYVQDRIPISFKDEKSGELAGVSREIFDRIQEVSGLKFQYQELPGGSVTYDYLMQEGFDLVTSVEYNGENLKANGILMSKPYLLSRKVIVGHEGVTLETNKKLKIAVSTGSQTLKKVLKKQYPNFEIVDYATIENCFEAVNNENGADFLIQNQYVAEYQMYKPQYEHLKVLPTAGLDDKLCFSAVIPMGNVQQSVLDEKQELIEILNKAIDQISEDEVANYIIKANMENQYHDTVSDFLYRYRYMVMILSLVFLLVCILIAIIIHTHIRSAKVHADAEIRAQFLSMMSHEIRTPLNGLLGLNYLVSNNLENEEKVRRYLQRSSEVAKYLMTLVNDILDMSKLQSKQVELQNKVFSLDETLAMAHSVSEGRMRDKGIEFLIKKRISYSTLVGDKVRIEQVVLHVLDNAYKFTPAGGRVTMEVSQKKRDDGRICSKIKIRDTGCGMSEEFQKKIFHSFTQERDTVSKGNQGAGLGMAISRNLAQMMDGDLTVKSKLGKGSCFTFTFVTDSIEGKEQELAEQAQERAGRSGNQRPRHVLVAEDNDLNAEIIMDLLEAGGFSATLAVNGQEAVDLFAASDVGTYDCILMDIMMPLKNGFEAARAIRKLNRSDASSVKIIACTANTFDEDKKNVMESGMDDFIAKPIDVDSLMEKLRGE